VKDQLAGAWAVREAVARTRGNSSTRLGVAKYHASVRAKLRGDLMDARRRGVYHEFVQVDLLAALDSSVLEAHSDVPLDAFKDTQEGVLFENRVAHS